MPKPAKGRVGRTLFTSNTAGLGSCRWKSGSELLAALGQSPAPCSCLLTLFAGPRCGTVRWGWLRCGRAVSLGPRLPSAAWQGSRRAPAPGSGGDGGGRTRCFLRTDTWPPFWVCQNPVDRKWETQL